MAYLDGISRWQFNIHSTTDKCKSRTIIRTKNILVDNRADGDYFYIRYFDPIELERLFFIPEGWVSNQCSKTRSNKLLGNTVIVKVIEHILVEGFGRSENFTIDQKCDDSN
jgi:hypothetical protein